jgi:RNA polymerase-binding protein DksA
LRKGTFLVVNSRKNCTFAASSFIKTMEKVRYTDVELAEFKAIIDDKLDTARKSYAALVEAMQQNNPSATDDTAPAFNKLEECDSSFSKEEAASMAERQRKFIERLEAALLRIQNKTYGVCRQTGKLIPADRLRAVPHATLSVEAKQQ